MAEKDNTNNDSNINDEEKALIASSSSSASTTMFPLNSKECCDKGLVNGNNSYGSLPAILIDIDATTTNEVEKSKKLAAKVWTSRSLLFLVAFLYGTLNVALRFVYDLPGPPSASALSATRGWLAALCFVPLIIQQHKSKTATGPQSSTTTVPTSSKNIWLIASELATWNFFAQGLLTLGLYYIESARASFLTQTSVVMTPVITAMAGQRVNSTVWIGCSFALAGLLLLSSAASPSTDSTTTPNSNGNFLFGLGQGFSVGDFIVLAGAFCWSLYIYRLSSIGNSYNEISLQAIKTFVLAILYTGWYVFDILFTTSNVIELWPGWTNILAWGFIFYSALGPGTFADVLQQKGQAVIAASEANIILSMEPVFTAILGRVLLGEATSLQEKLGGGFIILAALIATR